MFTGHDGPMFMPMGVGRMILGGDDGLNGTAEADSFLLGNSNSRGASLESVAEIPSFSFRSSESAAS